MTLDELVAVVLGVPIEQIDDDTAPHNTARWTSRAQIQLVVALEDLYGVSLSVVDIKSLTSVGAIRRLLVAKGRQVRRGEHPPLRDT